MTRHYKQHILVQAFERNAGRLRLELRLGTPRRHLDVLVELLETLHGDMTETLQAAAFGRELGDLRGLVKTRPSLRVVK